jgi:hypothetical protein
VSRPEFVSWDDATLGTDGLLGLERAPVCLHVLGQELVNDMWIAWRLTQFPPVKGFTFRTIGNAPIASAVTE